MYSQNIVFIFIGYLLCLVVAEETPCRKRFKHPEGKIEFTIKKGAGGFFPHTECVWQIRTDKGSSLFLKFSHFEMGSPRNNKCVDFFKIVDGISGRSLFMQCGQRQPFNITSDSYLVTMKVSSNWIHTTNPGIHLHWRTILSTTSLVQKKTKMLSTASHFYTYNLTKAMTQTIIKLTQSTLMSSIVSRKSSLSMSNATVTRPSTNHKRDHSEILTSQSASYSLSNEDFETTTVKRTTKVLTMSSALPYYTSPTKTTTLTTMTYSNSIHYTTVAGSYKMMSPYYFSINGIVLVGIVVATYIICRRKCKKRSSVSNDTSHVVHSSEIPVQSVDIFDFWRSHGVDNEDTNTVFYRDSFDSESAWEEQDRLTPFQDGHSQRVHALNDEDMDSIPNRDLFSSGSAWEARNHLYGTQAYQYDHLKLP